MKHLFEPLLFLFIILFVIVIFFPMGIRVGKEEGRNEMRQEVVEHGYGAWVLTNSSKTFIWNNDRVSYNHETVK